MIFKRFSFQVGLRTLMIAANTGVLASIFGDERLFFNQLILSVLLIAQIAEMIQFVNTTNRELSKFFDAIRQSDFTVSISKDYLGKSYAGLFQSMRLVIDTYKKVKIEKEAQFHLLQQIIGHVSTGIIVLKDQQEIVLLNDAAKRILEIPDYTTWNNIAVKNAPFAKAIDDLPENGRFLVEVPFGDTTKHISVDLSNFTMLEANYKLITFADIKSEIEQSEIDAWHKLIRILTHEIMNSVTPIASLSETMELMLTKKEESNEPVLPIIGDLLFSTKTIHKRSEGLLEFVEDYRKLTKIPKPDQKREQVQPLVDEMEELMASELSKRNIAFKKDVSSDIYGFFDKKLVTQILLNLVKNGMEALEGIEDPVLHIAAEEDKGAIRISVTDNGSGVDKKDLNDIWVPFYTTKPEGSGIGLSLSRQIMRMHHGTITLRSKPGKTTFVLTFPN